LNGMTQGNRSMTLLQVAPEAGIDLRTIPLFAHLRRDQVDRLKPHLKFSKYEEGEVVVAEGEQTKHKLFIFMEGVVSICKTAPYRDGTTPLVEL
jgi:hypothetical protein